MSNAIYSDKIKASVPLISDENGYYHLVYKIVNIINRKIYIGKHSTKNPYDDYFGSGKEIRSAIEKYGIENFTKEIIFCFDKEEDAFLKEAEIVNLDFVKNENTYNIAVGGNGYGGSWSGEKNPMYGKKHKQETKYKISTSHKGEKNPMYGMTGEKNPFYGKHHTKETREKLSNAAKRRCGENHPMYGKTGENSPNFGRKHTQESREKISKSNIGKKHTQESKDKMSKAKKGKYTGENNWMYGKTGENSPIFGEKNPRAKAVLKLDEFGNIVTEYGTVKDCCEQEHICGKALRKLIKEHTLYNSFYFEFKSKNQ